MKKKYVWILTVILYILFIYSNSMKVAEVSSEDSGKMLKLIHGFFSTFGVEAFWLTEHVLRKMGHFMEYALLGVLLYECLKSIGIESEKRWFVHIIIGYLVPFMDETIQLFVKGRSGQISDVWLDCAGIAFGTLFAGGVFLICKRMEKLHVEKLSNDTGV
ncbi:VanZ family protein [Lacrimispora sp. JR3]|uniref:VanZ family protein n=1 Tax=Lacrimispora sinapis TaxID=3111456 RepID=UPI00374A7689